MSPRRFRRPLPLLFAPHWIQGEEPLSHSFPLPGYQLAWDGTFNGNALNHSKWTYRTAIQVSSSQRKKNVAVSSGNPILHLRREKALPGKILIDHAAFYRSQQ